jgi:hypothetical protein
LRRASFLIGTELLRDSIGKLQSEYGRGVRDLHHHTVEPTRELLGEIGIHAMDLRQTERPTERLDQRRDMFLFPDIIVEGRVPRELATELTKVRRKFIRVAVPHVFEKDGGDMIGGITDTLI